MLLCFVLLGCISVISSGGLNINLARNGIATQSKPDLNYNGFIWSASLAIDGNTARSDPDNVHTCSGAERVANKRSWWQLDLRRQYTVNTVIVYGRIDNTNSLNYQLQDFQLYLSNSPDFGQNALNYNHYSENAYGNNGIYNISVTPAVTARYITVRHKTPYTVLIICEVQVYSDIDYCNHDLCHNGGSCDYVGASYICYCQVGYTGRNCETAVDFALSGIATQSKPDIFYNGFTWSASLAIDGNTARSDPNNVHTCSGAESTANGRSWWQLDLTRQYSVNTIIVYGRTDEQQVQLQGFQLYITNSSHEGMNSINYNNYSEAGYGNNGVYNISVTPAIKARYITVRHKTVNVPLTICEVQVYVDINGCSTNACENGGTCNDLADDFTCDCVVGFTGRNCSTNIDDCSPDPCENGGTCNDLVSNYTCDCVVGFKGQNCSTDIDDCSPNPCENGGTCNDLINNYTCDCVVGFTGWNCSTNIDDCFPNPCENGGTCNDFVRNYTCDCMVGFTGWNCSTACSHRKYGLNCTEDCGNCLHNDSCRNTDGKCARGCEPGWIGKPCKTECEDGKCGKDCLQTCGKCAGQSVKEAACHKATCNCTQGCAAKYQGRLCLEELKETQNSSPQTAAVGGGIAAVLLIILILLSIFIIYKRKRRGREREPVYTKPLESKAKPNNVHLKPQPYTEHVYEELSEAGGAIEKHAYPEVHKHLMGILAETGKTILYHTYEAFREKHRNLMTVSNNKPQVENIPSSLPEQYREVLRSGNIGPSASTGSQLIVLPSFENENGSILIEDNLKGERLWNVVSESDISCIVFIGKDGKLCKGDVVSVGDIIDVKCKQEPGGKFRRLNVLWANKIKKCTASVAVFECEFWSELDNVPVDIPGVIKMISEMENAMKDNKPFLICCQSNIRKGALFSVVMNSLQCLKKTDAVSIFEQILNVSKELTCVQNYEQFKFIHDVILQYVLDQETPF